MDFFEHQERARKSSRLLVLLFALAVAGIIASVYVAVMAFVATKMNGQFWEPRAFGGIAGGVLIVVAFGSLYKIAQLHGGGSVVATRLGGRRIDPGTGDLLERRVLNVVQEMAIAAGTPVPEVYVLDHESGINAFAAGHGEGDAVVAVTRGAMEKLTRDELQGVMGHEFSHLLNGDMRLNLRLMGVIHGILLIGIIGRVLMQGQGRGRRRDGGAQIALLGLALFAIGYIGTFFGNMIKAAVSRQREFLADASAVQFTRNPEGISHALAKIGGLAQGSRMTTALAAEASHMFFGDGMAHAVSSALATHPPLLDRIKRIDPSFAGSFPDVAADFVAAPEGAEVMAGAVAMAGAATAASGAARRAAPAPTPAPRAPRAQSGIDRIGRPGPEHIERARQLLESAPESLREAARTLDGAVALSYAVLLAPSGAERERQLAVVQAEDGGAAPAVARLVADVERLDSEARLPLLEVAGATLGALPPERHRAFADVVRDLVEGDRNVELSEWMLSRLLLRHLRAKLEPSKPRGPTYASTVFVNNEIAVLLSALAYAGVDDQAAAERAFEAAVADVGIPGMEPCARDRCPPRALEAALESLALLVPAEKRKLISACATSIAADGRVTDREAELFHVVADWLGVPVPPLLPGQLLS